MPNEHRTRSQKIPGDSSGEATPVPIPNTEVKLSSAEDTERAAFREHRSSPGFLRFRRLRRPPAPPRAAAILVAMTDPNDPEPSRPQATRPRRRIEPVRWPPSRASSGEAARRRSVPDRRARQVMARRDRRPEPSTPVGRATGPALPSVDKQRRPVGTGHVIAPPAAGAPDPRCRPAPSFAPDHRPSSSHRGRSRRRLRGLIEAVTRARRRRLAQVGLRRADGGRSSSSVRRVGSRWPASAAPSSDGAGSDRRVRPGVRATPARRPSATRRRRPIADGFSARRPDRRRRPGARAAAAVRRWHDLHGPAGRHAVGAIARDFGTTVKALQELNGIDDPSLIHSGAGPAGSRGRLRRATAAGRRLQRWQPRQTARSTKPPPGLTSVIRVPHRGHGWPPLLWTARKSRTWVSNVGGTRSRSTSIARASVEPVAA